MPLLETEAKSAPLSCETRHLGSPQRTKFVDYTAKRVVRGGVEPPTFRFSGGRSYQLSYLTSAEPAPRAWAPPTRAVLTGLEPVTSTLDRKSTRLNSSHLVI